MKKAAHQPDWNKNQTRRLWATILGTQALLMAALSVGVGKDTFYLLGPFIVFNLGIYFFPYFYFWNRYESPLKTKSALRFQEILRDAFPENVRVHCFVIDTHFENILTFAHRKTLWVATSKNFLEALKTSDQELIVQELLSLYKKGRLQGATLRTSLQKTLWVFGSKNNRGQELLFFSDNRSTAWAHLCFQLFHRLNTDPKKYDTFYMSNLLFPALAHYNSRSYLALYQYLREDLIESLDVKPPIQEPILREEKFYEL